MQRNCLVAIVFFIVVLIVGFGCESKPAAAEETEILKIAVGEPTKLSDLVTQIATIAASRTGVVAAFYDPRPSKRTLVFKTSADGGATWGPEMDAPPQMGGGCAETVALRDGGVLKQLCEGSGPMGEDEARRSPMEGEFKDGWFTLHSTWVWFNDDFTKYEVAPVQVYMPDAVTTKQPQLAVASWPVFDKGKILQLANGDLLAPMYGLFKGDTHSRVLLSRSSDRGHTWRYYATVAVQPTDPNPELPGQYLGYAEPSIELLPNGQMICVMRTQYSHLPGEYRPLYVSWSNDLGRTWTRPIPTKPHLMNISPTLAVMDNGVVACQYGRPGFHVAFSLDNGHTWQDRISFSHMPEPYITGQFDMIKVGPNKLVAIGNDAGWRHELVRSGYQKPEDLVTTGKDAAGLKVWPITVERVKVSPARVALEGRVLDHQGNPIANAKVERGPNRYTADDWLEHATKLDNWKAGPMLIGNPMLAFRSIQSANNYPTVLTDSQGRFRFDDVKLAEYVLTVEAQGYAPQHRHIKVDPRPEPADFTLKPGRLVRNRVVDDHGNPLAGVCVVLNRWHCHTDRSGFFHWSVEAPLPEQVDVRVDKRYSGQYETLETTLPFSQLGRKPIILRRKK